MANEREIERKGWKEGEGTGEMERRQKKRRKQNITKKRVPEKRDEQERNFENGKSRMVS